MAGICLRKLGRIYARPFNTYSSIKFIMLSKLDWCDSAVELSCGARLLASECRAADVCIDVVHYVCIGDSVCCRALRRVEMAAQWLPTADRLSPSDQMTLSDPQRARPEPRPRGRPFQKGNGGRRQGSRNRSTLLAEALISEEDKAELVRKAIELAKGGDVQLLKFFLDRILPKDRPVKIDLPEIKTSREAADGLLAIIQHVAAGKISPAEGATVANLVAGLEERLKDSEKRREESKQFNITVSPLDMGV